MVRRVTQPSGALQGVEQHALAQGIVADDEPLHPEHVDDLFEQQSTGQDDVGPLGIEPRNLAPLGHGVRLGQTGGDPPDVIGAELVTIPALGRIAAAKGDGDLGDGLGRARAGDGDLEFQLLGFVGERHQHRAHIAAARAEGRWVEAVGGEEPVREPHRTELQAARRSGFALVAEQQLGRPAADVEEEQGPVEHRHRLQHAEMDESSLLDPGDHLHAHACLGLGPVQKLVVVLGLAHRTGGDRSHRRPVAVGHLAEAVQGRHAPVDGVGREQLHVAGARSEAHHLLLPPDHLEPVVTGDASDDQVERVRSYVNRRQRVAHDWAR